jgi:hypothetical protein
MSEVRDESRVGGPSGSVLCEDGLIVVRSLDVWCSFVGGFWLTNRVYLSESSEACVRLHY